MKRLLLAGVCLGILAGCAAQTNDQETTQASVMAEMPKAELGNFGIDLTAVDEAVRPQDDFYRHVNGTWLETFEIPEDRN